ncbi:WXG100 family type VII secretion target [Bacillus massiliglaciei]|uniref:WXG100 family type VII secretion target n=1 Tax=Bacillus massiliglaciei TaxID=1816693 RepID=UPI0018FEC007|nr:WXG100 family type VII secretion target [Bacillus massiliglaciei]
MDTISKVRALARKYQQASDEGNEHKQNVTQLIHTYGDTWSGKTREKFEQLHDEINSKFVKYIHGMQDISEDLMNAANEMERIKAEKERLEQLRRLQELQRLNACRDLN